MEEKVLNEEEMKKYKEKLKEHIVKKVDEICQPVLDSVRENKKKTKK